MFIVPAMVVAVLAWTHLTETAIATIAATVAAILFFPLGVMFYDALGGSLMAGIALLIGIMSTLVAPLFPRMKYALATAVLAVIAALIALAQPPFTKERPRQIPLAYLDDARAKTPHWMTWELTDPLRRAAPFAPADPALTPWNRGGGYTAPAPSQAMPRVVLSGERKANIVTVRVRSPRGANRFVVRTRGGKIRRVNGVEPPPGRGRFASLNGWQSASAAGIDEMIVELTANDRIEVAASDATADLPASGAALLDARIASTANTYRDGDTTVTRAWGSW
jgi:hypothetical protein